MSAKTTRGASQLSAYNSTSTALDSGSTFTGIWEDTIGFTTIAFSVKTDQAGSLYADFSTDGINLDSTLTYSVAASTNEVHRLTITKKYYRLRFTNSSGSNQTYLRLQSILGEHPLLTSTLSSSMQADADAIVTRSVKTSVDASGYFAIFTVKNSLHFKGRTNQSVISLVGINGALKHNNPCTVYVIRNATLAGNPNFASYSSSSMSLYDTSATTCTFRSNDQLVESFSLGDTGNFDHIFEGSVVLQPGESVTIAAKTSFGTSSYVIASLNTREDQ